MTLVRDGAHTPAISTGDPGQIWVTTGGMGTNNEQTKGEWPAPAVLVDPPVSQ